jgi:hypothetical protein
LRQPPDGWRRRAIQPIEILPSRAKAADDLAFDRRRQTEQRGSSAADGSLARRASDAKRPAADQRTIEQIATVRDKESRKRRATRDGREPLVVYMRPESIKALKIAALEHDTTASAIVAEAVTFWLQYVSQQKAKSLR